MEDKDIDFLKECEDIRDLMGRGFQFPFDDFFEIKDEITTFRFGHDIEDDYFRNHETVYSQKIKGRGEELPTNVMYSCALSCYTSAESAESALNKFKKYRKNVRLRIGNSLLYGILKPEYGFISEPDKMTHFDFYQKNNCDMHAVFQLHKVLWPSGD